MTLSNALTLSLGAGAGAPIAIAKTAMADLVVRSRIEAIGCDH